MLLSNNEPPATRFSHQRYSSQAYSVAGAEEIKYSNHKLGLQNWQSPSNQHKSDALHCQKHGILHHATCNVTEKKKTKS